LKDGSWGRGMLSATTDAPESFASNLMLSTALNDAWVGVTLFRLLESSIGIGLTNYVAVRNQQTRSTASGEAIRADTLSFLATSRVADVSYTNVRLLWKLGVGVEVDQLTFGLTLTTPSVNLFGTGSAFVSFSKAVSDTSQKPILLATNQEDVSSLYKSSWAVGIGMGYRFGKARVHFSAEWYAAVPMFRVLETTSFTGQSDGLQHLVEVTDERRSVINAGAGLQYSVSPAVALYGSCVTDFSYVPEGTESNLSLTPWNLLHISFGTVLSLKSIELTLGLSFSGGSAPLKDVPWASFASSLGQVIGTSGVQDISYFSATGILAFTFKM
jgi:hypothetical protein